MLTEAAYSDQNTEGTGFFLPRNNLRVRNNKPIDNFIQQWKGARDPTTSYGYGCVHGPY